MRIKRLIMVLVMLAAWLAMMGIACGAEDDNKRDWEIPFIGTMQIPARMEIIEIRDVLAEALKFDQKQSAKGKVLPLPPKDKTAGKQQLSLEELDKFFRTYNFGIYQFAVKSDGTYSTALAFAVKTPGKMTPDMDNFFNKMRDSTTRQEDELHGVVLKGLEFAYTKEPGLRDIFEIEILEFYPFDHITSGDTEIVGIGCSVAFRAFKLIYPAAGKVFFIRKNNELYVFGLVNSGLDRKMWSEIGVSMIDSIRWNSPK